jgi:hypothetical protein
MNPVKMSNHCDRPVLAARIGRKPMGKSSSDTEPQVVSVTYPGFVDPPGQPSEAAQGQGGAGQLLLRIKNITSPLSKVTLSISAVSRVAG